MRHGARRARSRYGWQLRHPAHPHRPAAYRPLGAWPRPVDGGCRGRGGSVMTSVPLDELGEDELLERARKAMRRAATLPVGSVGRAVQWAAFDSVMAELDRRAIRFVLSRLERSWET